MELIKRINPHLDKMGSKEHFTGVTTFVSYIKHRDFFIFGCHSENCFASGLALYDKDFNLVKVDNTIVESKILSMVLTNNNHILLGEN
jgi:hypothetical protein